MGEVVQNRPCDGKFSEKCPCLHNNSTVIIKQISQFDTALVLKFQFKIKRIQFLTIKGVKTETWPKVPHPHTIKQYFSPILLGYVAG